MTPSWWLENVERVMVEGETAAQRGDAAVDVADPGRAGGDCDGALRGLRADGVLWRFYRGAIYRQFSVTIVSSMALSVLVALILTPALCATLLKPVSDDHHAQKAKFFVWFNARFDLSVNHYTQSVGGILRKTGRYLLLYLLIVVGMTVLFVRLPTSFLPEEDQGVFMTMVQLPSGATQARTQQVLDR